MRRRRPGNLVGVLLVAAGFDWFVTEWNNPAVASAIVFTVGLLSYASCPPLIAQAVLSYPGGRLGSRVEAIVVVTAYAGSPAENKNGFVVTSETAAKYNIKKLIDLAKTANS